MNVGFWIFADPTGKKARACESQAQTINALRTKGFSGEEIHIVTLPDEPADEIFKDNF